MSVLSAIEIALERQLDERDSIEALERTSSTEWMDRLWRALRPLCNLNQDHLIDPQVETAIGELFDHVFGASRDSATIRCRCVPPDGSRQVQRRLPPEEIEELVAAYLAGATALALAGTHSIHRTTVLALLERHQVSRRGRLLTPDHIEQAVSSYASGRSCTSIAKEFKVYPETIRQALLKAGVAMRRPGRPRPMQEA